MTTDANQEQISTETDSVTQDDKQDDLIEKRLSQMAAQKNQAREERDVAVKELADMKADQEKVRQQKLVEDGDLKTALQEKEIAVETLTADLESIQGKWDAHVSHRTEALNAVMDEAKFDDKTKELAMKYTDLDDREDFIKLFKTETNLPGTDNRRSTRTEVTLKPIAEMSDKEQRETHEQRLAQYR